MKIDQEHKDTLSIKEIAVSFLELVVLGKVREAYSHHVDPSFIHHNPYFPSDSNSLMLAMEEDAGMNPDKDIEIKQTIQEGNVVVVHSHVKQNPEDFGWAIVHIFRFEGNKIVELWDIAQQVPEDSPNEHGAF